MRKIQFSAAEIAVVNEAVAKVSANFVTELTKAFCMFPPKANMRFKQDLNGRLIIIVTVTYDNGKTQTLEGLGDYLKAEHDVEVAEEGENLVVEILRQYLGATTQCYIEKDWESPKGDRYRRVTFTPSFNMNIKFCLKATDEINNMILEACKPEWMKKAEAEQPAA